MALGDADSPNFSSAAGKSGSGTASNRVAASPCSTTYGAPVWSLRRAKDGGLSLRISDESTDLGFYAPDQIDGLPMHHTRRLRIRHFLERRDGPYLR